MHVYIDIFAVFWIWNLASNSFIPQIFEAHPSCAAPFSVNMSGSSAPATEAPNDGFDFRLYRYTPSLPAAIISVVVFAVLTAVHVWRLKKARAYYFTAFTVGGVCTLPLSAETKPAIEGSLRLTRVRAKQSNSSAISVAYGVISIHLPSAAT